MVPMLGPQVILMQSRLTEIRGTYLTENAYALPSLPSPTLHTRFAWFSQDSVY